MNKNTTKLRRHWVTDWFCRRRITVAVTARCKVVTRSSQLHQSQRRRSRGYIAVTSQLRHSCVRVIIKRSAAFTSLLIVCRYMCLL